MTAMMTSNQKRGQRFRTSERAQATWDLAYTSSDRKCSQSHQENSKCCINHRICKKWKLLYLQKKGNSIRTWTNRLFRNWRLCSRKWFRSSSTVQKSTTNWCRTSLWCFFGSFFHWLTTYCTSTTIRKWGNCLDSFRRWSSSTPATWSRSSGTSERVCRRYSERRQGSTRRRRS